MMEAGHFALPDRCSNRKDVQETLTLEDPMEGSMHFPLKCRCHASNWEFHASKVTCTNCHFTEHFEITEIVSSVIGRMRAQGCYFLEKDADKLKDYPVLQLSGHNYR
jgi:hypothetical protein